MAVAAAASAPQPQFTFDEFKTREFHENRMEYYNARLIEFGNELNLRTQEEINEFMRRYYATASREMQRAYDMLETHMCIMELICLDDYVNGNLLYNRYLIDLLLHIVKHRNNIDDIIFDMIIRLNENQ
jgi:hypothetical protein